MEVTIGAEVGVEGFSKMSYLFVDCVVQFNKKSFNLFFKSHQYDAVKTSGGIIYLFFYFVKLFVMNPKPLK
jgi:hypothetical protein